MALLFRRTWTKLLTLATRNIVLHTGQYDTGFCRRLLDFETIYNTIQIPSVILIIMPRGRPPKKASTTPIPVEPIETEEPTERFPFENETVIRPIPSVFQDRILPSARYVIPPVLDPADWAGLIAKEKEKVKALKKTHKNASEASKVDESNVSMVSDVSAVAPANNQTLILGRGTVIDYSAASGRIPELWTISYPLLKTDTMDVEEGDSDSCLLYTERITRNELVIAKAAAEKILASSALLITAFPLTTVQKYMTAYLHVENTWQERIDLGIETAIQHAILWKLIVVASCELEREFQIQKAFEETKKRLELQLQQQQEELKRNTTFQQCDCPKYYYKHPTTYMGGHFTKESTTITEITNPAGGDKTVTTATVFSHSTISPQHLAQRVKLGISKAYEYYSRVYSTADHDKDLSSFIPDSLLVGFEIRRRSARVLSSTTNTTVEDKTIDPIQSILPKDYEAGGAVALVFLHLLNLIPPDVPKTIDFTALETYEQYLQRERTALDQPPISILEIQQQQDNDDIVNPFYMPSSQAIMVHLGRKQKSMTPTDIQTAICYATEDSIPLPFSVTPPPTSHIKNQVSEPSSTLRICLDCTSGDSLKELPEMESSIFSKCRFALKSCKLETAITEIDAKRIKEERELRKQREFELKQAELEEFKREERSWRLKKQFETWRFKSIQSGCTIWPSWISYVGDKLKEIYAQSNLLEDGMSLNGNKDGFTNFLTSGDGCQEKKHSDQEEKDAEMAANLALELNTGVETAVGFGDGQRRSRRAGRESNSEGISFYGSSSSLAPQQLLETIHRLVVTVYPKHITLFDLHKILIDGHGDIKGTELRRIRSALGKIVFRQGKVERLLVTSDSDSICWSTILGDEKSKGEALVQLGPSHVHESPSPLSLNAPNNMDMDASNGVVESGIPKNEGIVVHCPLEQVDNGPQEEGIIGESRRNEVINDESLQDKEKGDDRPQGQENGPESPRDQEKGDCSQHDQDVDKNAESISAIQSCNPNNRLIQASLHDSDKERKEIKILEAYMASLHRVELTLRYLLLKKYRSGNGLQSVTPEIVAVAADEKEGDVDASDTKEIEELDKDGKIVWICDPPHPLLGQVLYRPDLGETDTSNTSSKWYKVLDYIPSIPVTNAAVDQSKSSSEITEGVRDNVFVERRVHFRVGPTYLSNRQALKRTFILTEAQVKAGIKAAQLESDYTDTLSTSKLMKHPFDGLDGSNFLLSPYGSESSAFFYVRMAGHDTYLSSDRKTLDYRVLLIVDEGNNVSDDAEKIEHLQPGNAFWATISSDASIISPLHMDSKFKIIPQEYHSSTPAYAACEAVIEYLKSNIKIVPFLKPVDPVALQIPTYFDVIKKPMDLSTVESNLLKGEYGRIPPNDTFSSPISKMLNGPFYSHIMRIFDNAIIFNRPGDWIHADATQLKRLASKKIETLTLKAEREAQPTAGSHGSLKRSMYKEVDSDGDAYEYESDYEDEDNHGKRRKRRATTENRTLHYGKTSSKLEDHSCRPIEGPVNVPASVGIGIFSELPISSDARFFGLPQEWCCRLSKDSNEKSTKSIEEEERQQLILLQMQLDQQNVTRRSSRSHDAVTENLLARKGNASESNLRLEFFIADEGYMLKENVSDNNLARSRVHVESIRETLHDEYFARLYYKYFATNHSSPVSATTFHYGEGDIHGLGYGMYTDNSFPPFLGRIIPVGFSPSQLDGCDLKWEIRQPFILPALGWVLRGLVQSGHLSEIEPLSSGLSENNIQVNDGVLLINHAYYTSNSMKPYDLIDVKEILRRKKADNTVVQEHIRPDVHLSDYEKARLERVERNKERLRMLGLL